MTLVTRRVVELFEARKPRETAIISEIDGVVKFGEVSKGQRKIYVTADDGEEKEYSVQRGVHVNAQEGERLKPPSPCHPGRSEAQSRDLRFRGSSVGMFFDKADLRFLLVLKRTQKPLRFGPRCSNSAT